MMVNKNFCMSSFLALRYIERKDLIFTDRLPYRHPILPKDKDRILVHSADDIDQNIKKQLYAIQREKTKVGILLSGGMDSAILASYLPGCDAYTFRFLNGEYQIEELRRAEYYSNYYGLKLHYVDINWNTVANNLKPVMKSKGGPVHSIEPQIYQGAKQAGEDGVNLMIIGDGSDYVFGGMDLLLSKDWKFDEFVQRYIYVNPFDVLKKPESIQYLFERYRKGKFIDFIRFLDIVATEESYGSYSNAFFASGMDYFDPYAKLKMAEPIDLKRIRNGESKYLVRELFKKKYPEISVPNKLPMPRPVDKYFNNWKGPTRKEFKENIAIQRFTGNQKWLIWCLEQFLNMIDEL